MIDYVLRSSLEQGSVVTIVYTKDGVITERDTKVMEIGDTCIKAYCYWRRQNRVFRLDNILAAGMGREGAGARM